MCDHGITRTTKVKNKLNGSIYSASIDSCIAPIISTLQKIGVITVASCCGHGKWHGHILLLDGRLIVIDDSMPIKILNKGVIAYEDIFEERGQYWSEKMESNAGLYSQFSLLLMAMIHKNPSIKRRKFICLPD